MCIEDLIHAWCIGCSERPYKLVQLRSLLGRDSQQLVAQWIQIFLNKWQTMLIILHIKWNAGKNTFYKCLIVRQGILSTKIILLGLKILFPCIRTEKSNTFVSSGAGKALGLLSFWKSMKLFSSFATQVMVNNNLYIKILALGC